MNPVLLSEEFLAYVPAQAGITVPRRWKEFGSTDFLCSGYLIFKHAPAYSGRLKVGMCLTLFVVNVTDFIGS